MARERISGCGAPDGCARHPKGDGRARQKRRQQRRRTTKQNKLIESRGRATKRSCLGHCCGLLFQTPPRKRLEQRRASFVSIGAVCGAAIGGRNVPMRTTTLDPVDSVRFPCRWSLLLSRLTRGSTRAFQARVDSTRLGSGVAGRFFGLVDPRFDSRVFQRPSLDPTPAVDSFVLLIRGSTRGFPDAPSAPWGLTRAPDPRVACVG